MGFCETSVTSVTFGILGIPSFALSRNARAGDSRYRTGTVPVVVVGPY